MTSFNSMRRELLRAGSLGMAGAAIPELSIAASTRTHDPTSAGYFDVRKFGAAGDGKTLDTEAINRAIEAAAAAGGGVVVFPAGTYLCFSIHLKSHVASASPRRQHHRGRRLALPGETTGYNGGVYDAAEPKTAWDTYQDYGHNHWHNSLLWGEDIHDFGITGPGLIYGKGLSFGAGPPLAATIRSTSQSSPASATRPSLSRTAATCCCATSPSSRAATSACCSPASTTSPSTISRSTPTATASTSTAARTCASPTAPSTRPGTTASAPSRAMPSATPAPRAT